MAVARLALYSGEREPYRMEANRNGKCSCGLHTSKAAHDTAVEAHLTATLETAIVRAVLPDAASRRAFLAAVGMGTTLAAISEIFSIAKATELALSTPGRNREEATQNRFYPDHLCNADHHGRTAWLLSQAWARGRSHQDRRLGGDPRQGAQQGIRRRAHAVANAARDHAWRRCCTAAVDDAGNRKHQRPGDHSLAEAQGQARPDAVEGFEIRCSLRLFDA